MNWIDGLPRPARAALLRGASARRFAAGELIYGLEDEPGGSFLVQEGSARLYIGRADGRQLILKICQKGDMFGQTLSIDGGPAPIFAEARTALTVSFFSYRLLKRLRREMPEVAEGLAVQAASTSRDLMRVIGDLALSPLAGRTLSRLGRLAAESAAAEDEDGWTPIDITQTELASMLAASRPAVNKALRRFEEDGLIRCAFRRIAVKRGKLRSKLSGS